MVEAHDCQYDVCSPAFNDEPYEKAYEQAKQDYYDFVTDAEKDKMAAMYPDAEWEEIKIDVKSIVVYDLRKQVEKDSTEEMDHEMV